MKTFMTKSKYKLNSTKGESISETLVSLLIASLALVMLAGAISATSNMITKTRSALDRYYKANEVVVNMDGVGADGEDSVVENNKIITVYQEGKSSSFGINVKCFKNKVFGGHEVVSYKSNNYGG